MIGQSQMGGRAGCGVSAAVTRCLGGGHEGSRWRSRGVSAEITRCLGGLVAEVLTSLNAGFLSPSLSHPSPSLPPSLSCPLWRVQPRSDEFYLRAVIGSANFRTGGDFNDFVHGWLNYQIGPCASRPPPARLSAAVHACTQVCVRVRAREFHIYSRAHNH